MDPNFKNRSKSLDACPNAGCCREIVHSRGATRGYIDNIQKCTKNICNFNRPIGDTNRYFMVNDNDFWTTSVANIEELNNVKISIPAAEGDVLTYSMGTWTAQRLGGGTTQGIQAVAIGIDAGGTTQGPRAVAIGNMSGETNQGGDGVSVGWQSGKTSQGALAVAIGRNSGTNQQGTASVAIGVQTGANHQGESAVAIGTLAGATSQGDYAVAIGNKAGITNQHSGTIVISAMDGVLPDASNPLSPSTLIATGGDNRLYIKPIRNVTGVNAGFIPLVYNPTTGEIGYLP